MNKTRCTWCLKHPEEIDYHDNIWGVKEIDDQKLWEKLILDGQQAGLSWYTILCKQKNYYLAFDNFDIKKIIKYNDSKIDELMLNSGIIRNKHKIKAIINNAIVYKYHFLDNDNSFSDFLWSFVDYKTIVNFHKDKTTILTQSVESENMSKDLKKLGFKFVGPTICYAFMQAVGMINDHTIDCFRFNEV